MSKETIFYSVQTCLSPGRSVESPDKSGQVVRNKFTGVITDNHIIFLKHDPENKKAYGF